MGFLLKIVEGPNKGAEIALVEGVSVTLGKSDDCDIVLADQTLPDGPASILANADSVALDGETLEPFHVATRGATSFAIGPAGAPWGALQWPERETASHDDVGGQASNAAAGESASRKDAEAHGGNEGTPAASSPPNGEKKRGGCLGCLFVLLLLLIALAAAGWFFRDRLQPCKDGIRSFFRSRFHEMQSGNVSVDRQPEFPAVSALAAVASKYDLSCEESDGFAKMSGNLKTRRERLAATAEAYAAFPGVDLDLSDDESLRLSAEDALFTFTEGRVKVVVATNRCIAVAGVLHTPYELGKMIDGLKSDLPKLSGVDVSAVRLDGLTPAPSASIDAPAGYSAPAASPASARISPARQAVNLPVCGILTSPYPCLVMKNGTRLLPGAAIGENTILEIAADSVVLTNSTGRFEWRP